MKKYLGILVVGIILRIILATVTYHPDIRAFDVGGELVSFGKILSFYDYLPSLPYDDPLRRSTEFIYPPPIYLIQGIFNFIFNDIFKSPFSYQFLLDDSQNFGNLAFSTHLLIVKIPYFIFDILIGFLLVALTSAGLKKLAFTLWIFNPVTLYATYMMGQFDIIPTFFTVLSIYLVLKDKLKLAALALGGGIAFKLYPIFLLIPLLILGKTYFDKFKLGVLAILPYILSIAPYLKSASFRSTALVANQADKSLYASIPVSGGEAILLFPAFLILFYLLIWERQINRLSFWRFFLIPLLLFFIFTHYHPQWFIWVTPFLILDLVIERFKHLLPILMIFVSWFGSLFFFDPSLTIGIFSPLFPVLSNTSDIWTLLNINIDYNFSRSMLQAVFVASSLYLIYYHFPKNNKA